MLSSLNRLLPSSWNASDACRLHPALAQVYENVTFGGIKHLRIADEEGMFERTVTLGSSSKLYGLTGEEGEIAVVVETI